MSTKRYESRGVTGPMHCRTRTRLHELMKMVAVPLLSLLLTAAVCGQSALDGFDPNANGNVRVVVQPDGKILIGGDFATLSLRMAATALLAVSADAGSFTVK